MQIHWLFFAIVPFLEGLRIYFLAGDMRKMAEKKGETPGPWIWSTVALWVGVEGGIFFAWWYFLDGRYLLAAVFAAILGARLLFQFLKQNLSRRPDVSFEDKIDQIGSSRESNSANGSGPAPSHE